MSLTNDLIKVAAIAPFVSLVALPAYGASFDTTGISFNQDTEVTFEFLASYGSYSSDFGVVEIDEFGEIVEESKTVLLFEEDRGYDLDEEGNYIEDFLGTVGETVIDPVSSFVFEAGKQYSLFLQSFTSGATQRFNENVIVYSSNDLNEDVGFGTTQSLFSGDVFGSGAILAWDDTGNDNDRDFNDFFVKATASPVESIPEPATLLGLGLVAGMMTLKRRRA